MENKWMDISQPLTNGMAHWPGDTPFEYSCVTKEQTGSVNIGRIMTSLHMGTHIDAPFHVADDGQKVHELPLDVYIGSARLIDVTGHESIGKRELEQEDLVGVTRLLLRTAQHPNADVFPENFTYLREDIGPFLLEKGIRLIGVDVPSVDPVDSKSMSGHHSLINNGVYILENLVLTDVEPGDYELIALPLPIQGGDGSPVRAVIRGLGRTAP